MEDFIKSTLSDAGKALLSYINADYATTAKKSNIDIVTEADLASENIIVAAIKSRFPEHGIISEELGEYNADAENIWYIDPLDGTRNFKSKVPLFGINIAMSHKGDFQYAAIYLPMLDEFCFAEKGKGAYINGRKMSCSSSDAWESAYGIVAPDISKSFRDFLENFEMLSKGSGWITAIAAPSVCGVWVADGRRDWYVGPSTKSWDYAAPALIAKEAGCAVKSFDGEDWKPGKQGLIICNQALFSRLLEITRKSFLE